jgi:DNA-binding transcriptional LysR family regulator
MDSWDDLRFLLAVARGGTLTAAARALGCSQPTVGRKLAQLSKSRGAALLALESGRYVLTDAGRRVARHAGQMEEQFHRIGREIDRLDERPQGLVRVSVPEGIGLSVIAPLLPAFLREHPGLELTLVAESPIADLARREADVALRVVRPRQRELLVRRLASVPFFPCASAAYLKRRPRAGLALLPDDEVVGFHASMGLTPDMAWLRARVPRGTMRVRVRTPLAVRDAVAAGAGVGLLASYLARGLKVLDAPPLMRELFLVFHREYRQVARIRVVSDFLASAVLNSQR